MQQYTEKELTIFMAGATPYSDNRGVSAIFRGTIELLQNLQSRKLKMYVWHTFPESTQRYLNSAATTHLIFSSNVKIIPKKNSYESVEKHAILGHVFKLCFLICAMCYVRLFRLLRLKISPKLEILSELLSSDFIVELNFGDIFTDFYYGRIMWFLNVLRLFLLNLSKKPVYMFPQSIGPFKSVFSRAIARIMLKKAKMVAVREFHSLECVLNLGVNKDNVYFAPDTSYWMPIISATDASKLLQEVGINKSDSNKKLVGIILSGNSLTKRKNIVPLQTIAKTVDHLIDKLGVEVVFIPHVTSVSPSFDTRALSLLTQEMLKNKDHTVVLTKEYTVEELWGIIGLCDIVISTLTHPVMSSLRQCIPVIALGYSHKTLGIMKLFHMDKYLLTYDDFSASNLIELAKEVIENSDAIKQHSRNKRSFLEESMNKFKQVFYELLKSYQLKNGGAAML